MTKRLSAHPELVEEFFSETAEGIPDYLGIVDQALKSPNRFNRGEEVDRNIAKEKIFYGSISVSNRNYLRYA